jgi:large subunit ribosomal protein L6
VADLTRFTSFKDNNMSRIGKKPVTLPKGVKVTVNGAEAVVEGSKGKLTCPIPNGINLDVKADSISLARINDEPQVRAFHGLTRALLQNAITGVTEGWKRELDIVGVGYKAAVEGSVLRLDLGYSHPIFFNPPQGIQVVVEKNTHITITGTDRQVVGQAAADIRRYRSPEPYKGKGIRYTGEAVRRKAGKTGK